MSEHLDPIHHTGVIQSSEDALDKLWWNYQVYEHQLSVRGMGDEQGYAVIDFAIASSSVHAWVCAEYRDGLAAGSIQPIFGPAEGISEALRARVKWWTELRAIGNATKHRRLEERYWPGGVNRPTLQGDPGDTLDGDLDAESFGRFIDKINSGEVWYESAFHDPQTGNGVLAREALLQNYSGWHDIVTQLREVSQRK